jgi:hypothetical protein
MEELDIWGNPVSPALHEFKWALKTLKAGGKVRRAKWAKGSYVYVNQHNILVFYLNGELSPIRRVREIAHNCDWQDLSATDWQAHG